MKILGLEFSSEQRSVALGEMTREGCRTIAHLEESVGQRGFSGLALIDRVLRDANVPPEAVEVIAIGLGPGSYAGVRSAIAIGQGWQLARGTKLAGVSSADVVAEVARFRGILGEVSVVIDAQRGELYRGLYRISQESFSSAPLEIIPAEGGEADRRRIGPAAGGKDRIYPTAAALIQVAATRHEYTSGESIEPIYLRPTAFVKAAPPRFPSK